MNDRALGKSWFDPWRGVILIFFAAFGQFLGVVHTYTIGTLMGPISRDLGWSTSGILAALTIVGVCVFFLSPFVGALVDRLGSRVIGLFGLAMFGLAMLLLSVVGASIWMWWAASIVIGLAAVITKPTVWAAGVALEFDKRRGLALGFALCGAGVATATWPLIAHYLLQHFDWRGVYQILAMTFIFAALPIFFLGFHPRRAAEHREGVLTAKRPLFSADVRRFMRSGRFLRMMAAAFLMTVATPAVIVSFVPIQLAMGADRETAAAIAGIIGVASIIGRLSTGYLLDRIHGTTIAFVTFCIPIAGCLILLVQPDHSVLYASLAAACFGAALGAELDTLAYLVSRYFGAHNFGTIFGFLVGLMMLATGLGPLLLGLIKDATGSYATGLIAMIPIFAVSACLIATLGPYPDETKIAQPA